MFLHATRMRLIWCVKQRDRCTKTKMTSAISYLVIKRNIHSSMESSARTFPSLNFVHFSNGPFSVSQQKQLGIDVRNVLKRWEENETEIQWFPDRWDRSARASQTAENSFTFHHRQSAAWPVHKRRRVKKKEHCQRQRRRDLEPEKAFEKRWRG